MYKPTKKKKKEKRKREWKREKIDRRIIPRKWTSNKIDEVKVQMQLKTDDWALGLGWKIFRIMRIIMAMDYL